MTTIADYLHHHSSSTSPFLFQISSASSDEKIVNEKQLSRLQLKQSALQIKRQYLCNHNHSENIITLAVFLFNSNSVKILETFSACWMTKNVIPFPVSWEFIKNNNDSSSLRDLVEDAQSQIERYYCSNSQSKISVITVKVFSFDSVSDEFAKTFCEKGKEQQYFHCSLEVESKHEDETNISQQKEEHVLETDIALILHTSGTTRKPQPILLTHKNIIANQKMTSEEYFVSSPSSSTSLLVLPMFHGFSILSQFLPILLSASSSDRRLVVLSSSLSSSPNSHNIISAIQMFDSSSENNNSQKITSLCCVPQIFEQISTSLLLSFSSAEEISLNEIIVGGAPLTLSHQKELAEKVKQKFNITVRGLLGVTELSGTIMMSPLPSSSDSTNLLSLASSEKEKWFHFVEADENNSQDDQNEKELVVDKDCPLLSPSVTIDIEKGLFRTGDLFSICGGGSSSNKNNDNCCCRHVGRKDDCFRLSNGKTINPLLVEDVFRGNLSSTTTVFCCANSDSSFFLVFIFDDDRIRIKDDEKIIIQNELSKISQQYIIRDWELQVHHQFSSSSSKTSTGSSLMIARTPKGSIKDRKSTRQKILLNNNNTTTARREEEQESNHTKIRKLVEDFIIKEEKDRLVFLKDDSIQMAVFVEKLKRKISSSASSSSFSIPSLIEFLVFFQKFENYQDQLINFILNKGEEETKRQSDDHKEKMTGNKRMMMNLTSNQCKKFIKDVLKLEKEIEINDDSREDSVFALIEKLAQAFIVHVPFQSLTLISVQPVSKRRLPTWHEICDACFNKIGGQCFVLNPFFCALLNGVIFSSTTALHDESAIIKKIYLGRCSIHQVEDCHVTTFVEMRDDRLFLIDVASGYLFPILIELPQINKTITKSYYRYNSLLICSERASSSPSLLWNIWHLPIRKRIRNMNTRTAEDLWNEVAASHYSVPSLFMTTTATATSPLFSSMPSSNQEQLSPQEQVYLNYSKLRMSRGILTGEHRKLPSIIYLKADVCSNNKFKNCLLIKEEYGEDSSVTWIEEQVEDDDQEKWKGLMKEYFGS